MAILTRISAADWVQNQSAVFLFMKKTISLILIILLSLTWGLPAFAVNVGDPYKYVYTVLDSDRDPVTDLDPQIKIQRASDGAWLDFADNTFKASGWSEQITSLTEDSTAGFYWYTFTPPASETGPNQYLVIVDLDDAIYPDYQPFLIAYEDNALNKYVNGLKDNGDFEGIEKMIRVQR